MKQIKKPFRSKTRWESYKEDYAKLKMKIGFLWLKYNNNQSDHFSKLTKNGQLISFGPNKTSFIKIYLLNVYLKPALK